MDMLNVFLMVYVGGAILVTAAFAIIAMTAFILSKEDKGTEDDERYKDAECCVSCYGPCGMCSGHMAPTCFGVGVGCHHDKIKRKTGCC